MQVQIAFDPGLHLDAAQFAAAWNGNLDCAAVGHATVQPAPATTFLPPEILAAGMVLLGDITLNLASDALYDLIKMTIARSRSPQSSSKKTTEIVQLTQPDGTELLIVRIVE